MYEVQYEVLAGVNLLAVGRSETDQGTWLQVRPTRQKDSCWVDSRNVKLNGDPQSLALTYPGSAPLPASQLYPPLAGVAALRTGDQVTISWTEVQVPYNFLQSPTIAIYLVELWTCRNGQLVFAPMGTAAGHVTLTDQAGCSQPSYARLYLAVRDGYVGPTDVTWPARVAAVPTP